MNTRFRLALGAALILTLNAGAALAGPAVLSADMLMRDGPGDEFSTIAMIPGGSQVDVRECNFEQWCLVSHRDLSGWVHVKRLEEARRTGSGGTGVADVGSSASNDSTGPGGPAGGKKGIRPGKSPGNSDNDGDEGMSSKDAATLPGNDSGNSGGGRPSPTGGSSSDSGGTTKGDRLEASGGTPDAPAGATKK